MTAVESSRFEAQLATAASHVVADFAVESRAMLVVFGGIAGGISMPVFEFFRMTAGYPVKKLFFRDPTRGWYLRGLPGVGAGVPALAAYIRDQITAQAVERVVMAGASAGGFAALLFGALAGANVVHAFSPQAFVDGPNRRRVGDGRWPEQIQALHRDVGESGPYLDLRSVLGERAGMPRCHVHVSANDALDVAHARHLADLPNVVVHEYAGGGHKLVKRLRDKGVLDRLLHDSLRGSECAG